MDKLEISVQQGAIQEVDADLIVVNLFEGMETPGGATGAVDRALEGAIRERIAAGDLKGKLNETALFYPRGAIPARRVLVVGLGKPDAFNLERVLQVAATAARKARELGVKHLATIVHGGGAAGLDLEAAAQAVVEGTLLGLYRFLDHKSEPPEEADPERLTLVEFSDEKLPAVQAGARTGETVARAVALTRDLVNQPANVATPDYLATKAAELAQALGMGLTVLDEAAMAQLGMGALLAVTRASDLPARFIVLEHRPEGVDAPPVVLVGKGITFDTGGVNLKTAEGMQAMKGDMAGAAAVMGTMAAVASLNLPRPVVGLMPACENKPGGRAYRPGDVLRAMNGKTIEVINTDAEGRLILADALAYAARYRPAAVVDLATLTGACVIALGAGMAAGLFASDEDLARRIEEAAQATGERVWRLPLWEDYLEKMRSDVADLKNSAGRFGGVGTSAIFLKQFVGDFPWAHLDIAPVAGIARETNTLPPYLTKGGTGYGVRLMTALLHRWAA
ncbi:MAG: leucyl aminopeptidase [Chloroflexi bacterium]|nr:MAG: leucyl aminopeptidase [Chloroflexota bacterium]